MNNCKQVNKHVLSTAFQVHFYLMMKHVSDSVTAGCVSAALCRGVFYSGSLTVSVRLWKWRVLLLCDAITLRNVVLTVFRG